MKFADYFERTRRFSIGLGLLDRSTEGFIDICVNRVEIGTNGRTFYPAVLVISNNGFMTMVPNIEVPELNESDYSGLQSTFVKDLQQYLADKKEPVAADSNK